MDISQHISELLLWDPKLPDGSLDWNKRENEESVMLSLDTMLIKPYEYNTMANYPDPVPAQQHLEHIQTFDWKEAAKLKVDGEFSTQWSESHKLNEHITKPYPNCLSGQHVREECHTSECEAAWIKVVDMIKKVLSINKIRSGHGSHDCNEKIKRHTGMRQETKKIFQYTAPGYSYSVPELPEKEITDLFYSTHLFTNTLKSSYSKDAHSGNSNLPMEISAECPLQRIEKPRALKMTDSRSAPVKQPTPTNARVRSIRPVTPTYPFVSLKQKDQLVIGPFGTLLSRDTYLGIDWSESKEVIIKKLLAGIIRRETLPNHNLRHVNQPKLDTNTINDLIYLITISSKKKSRKRKRDI